ncbi:sigma-54 dependent transcriptional regulator [uncultured Planktosalinus sp.]|mgnify:CR=1 FL=1|uniref:sigma-54-dependent transcriptional regulator n=1 Tax=uncultured Planktosalinus sp. TaxID=1810935 RepID=UPI0030D82AF5
MALKKENILLVDDDYDLLEVLQRNLTALDYHSYKAQSVTDALEILSNSKIDLLVTDLQMPGINGLELVKYVSEHYPKIPVLVITGYPSVDGAVDAMRSGAIDYLVKPFTKDELSRAISKSLDKIAPSASAKTGTIHSQHPMMYAGMIGASKQMKELADIIERVKNNRATILIQGESGTGKELVARAIHYKGAFAANPFIAVNCGAIPENLLEAELFGYEKGAFTGAEQSREGFFQAAEGGTIFLDEIGTASAAVQTGLLRVLQEREVRKVGSRKSVKINLRVIAATNINLKQLIQNDTFREDLYYRLNVVTIPTIPLRNRKDDIMPLTAQFLKKYSLEYGKTGVSMTGKVKEILLRYDWPGNVRELENTLQHALIMCDTTLDVSHLPQHIKYPMPEAEGGQLSLREMEKKHIQNVLASVDNNKTKAAEILGIDRKTLRQKLK